MIIFNDDSNECYLKQKNIVLNILVTTNGHIYICLVSFTQT